MILRRGFHMETKTMVHELCPDTELTRRRAADESFSGVGEIEDDDEGISRL